MITDLILEFFTTVVVGLIDLLPDPPADLESGLETATLHLGTVVETISPFEIVIPFSAFFQAAGVAITSMLVQVAIRVVRIIASFITLGGGM